MSRVQLVDRFLNYVAHAVTCLLPVCLRRIGLIAGGGAGIIAGAVAYGGDYDYTLKTGRDERRAGGAESIRPGGGSGKGARVSCIMGAWAARAEGGLALRVLRY